MAALGAGAQTPCFLAFNEQNSAVTTFCVGQQISFRDNTGQPNITEFYDFDDRDGTDFSAQETAHTFTVPGSYVVTQLRGVSNFCSRTFVVKAIPPASPPALQALSITPTGLLLQVSSAAVNDLVLERAASAAGPFTPVETLSAVPEGQREHILTTTQTSGCFRLRAINLCTGEETTTSNVLCAQSLAVAAGDRQNLLSWLPNPTTAQIVNYQVLRGGQLYQTLAPNVLSFSDNQVACGRLYSYTVVAVFANGNRSAALPVQIETQGTTPPAAAYLLASFNLQNQVITEAVIPAQENFKALDLYRSLNGGAFSLFLENQPQNATDATLSNLSQRPCYQITYTDSCNLTSPQSNTARPAILSASLRPEDGAVQLSWAPYEGFASGIGTQTLQLLDEQGQVYWSTPASGQSYVDLQPQQNFQRLTYRLLTRSSSGEYESASNTVSVDQPFQFFFPTAFSPNGDGLNDVFRAVGRFASTFRLQVLNRWGQVIFEAKSPQEGWDGTYNGKPVPPETYLYRLEATDVNRERLVKSGKITLVR